MRHQWLISCLLFLFMNPLCGMESTTDKEKGLKEIIPARGKIKLLVKILRDYRLENPAKAIVFGDMALRILTEFPDT
ncbi:MAG: hypothetical protein GY757_15465, partial [bacterium]|nr:hypothetical protein [bacterium]